MTQSELALYLRDHKIDPNKNIMPSFTRDIDEDGRPDGYDFNRKTSFADGTIKLVDMGNVLSIDNLCGLPEGKVKFTADWKGSLTGEIKFVFIRGNRKIGEQTLPVKFSNSPGVKSEFVFELPKGTGSLQFSIVSTSHKTNAVLSNLDLRAAK